jgi:hypothetical protein
MTTSSLSARNFWTPWTSRRGIGFFVRQFEGHQPLPFSKPYDSFATVAHRGEPVGHLPEHIAKNVRAEEAIMGSS